MTDHLQADFFHLRGDDDEEAVNLGVEWFKPDPGDGPGDWCFTVHAKALRTTKQGGMLEPDTGREMQFYLTPEEALDLYAFLQFALDATVAWAAQEREDANPGIAERRARVEQLRRKSDDHNPKRPEGMPERLWAGALALAAHRHPTEEYPQPLDFEDAQVVLNEVMAR